MRAVCEMSARLIEPLRTSTLATDASLMSMPATVPFLIWAPVIIAPAKAEAAVQAIAVAEMATMVESFGVMTCCLS